MNDLFCLKSDLTSNYRNKVKESLILNAHALYFYSHPIYAHPTYARQAYSPNYLISSNSNSFFTEFFIEFFSRRFIKTFTKIFTNQATAKPSFSIATYTSSPRRYLLCLPFW